TLCRSPHGVQLRTPFTGHGAPRQPRISPTRAGPRPPSRAAARRSGGRPRGLAACRGRHDPYGARLLCLRIPVAESNAKSPGLADGLAFERPLLEMEQKIQELKGLALTTHLDVHGEVVALEERLRRQTAEVYDQLSAWERVNVARHGDRPLTSDYIQLMLDDFVELHGDRVFGEDRAIVCGLASMRGKNFMLIGHRKGKTVKERLACNFG